MSLERQAFRARHARTIARLFDASDAGRWRVSPDSLETSLHASVAHRFADAPAAAEVERYLESLHVKELAALETGGKADLVFLVTPCPDAIKDKRQYETEHRGDAGPP